jgi:hypothetical protein
MAERLYAGECWVLSTVGNALGCFWVEIDVVGKHRRRTLVTLQVPASVGEQLEAAGSLFLILDMVVSCAAESGWCSQRRLLFCSTNPRQLTQRENLPSRSLGLHRNQMRRRMSNRGT